MTISSTNRKAGPFIGNGSASVFAFSFRVFQASDLEVVRINVATGAETTLVINSGYTVALNADQNNNPGGSVTLVGGALASGYNLVLTSDIANLQPTDLTNQGGFYPEVITQALDRATIQIQQLDEHIGRGLSFPITDPALATELPAVSLRAGKALSFDSLGNPIVVDLNIPSTVILNNSIEFETFSSLSSDVSLAYSNVSVGQTIHVRKGDFMYTVASSSATNYDALTAGGVKVNVLPNNGTYQIDAFGAVGNGSRDDTAAFNKFRAAAIAAGGAITLNFGTNKTYMCSNPFWPTDIKTLIVNGNGSRLKNNATAGTDKMLLCPSHGQDIDGLGTFYNPVSRYLIATAAVGANTVTCLTAAEAGNFSVGEWLMVGSFDLQYYGYPSNVKFFEFKEVTAVNSGTGVITLADPLRYAHQSDFPYKVYTHGEGRACVYKIEQASKWNIDHTYNDIIFVKNDVDTLACVQATYGTGRLITFNRCESPYFMPHVAETVHLNGCIQTLQGEWDKLVSNVVATDCIFKINIYTATSYKNVKATRCTFSNGYDIGGETLELIDCNVSLNPTSPGDVGLYTAYNTCQYVKIVGGNHEVLPSISIQHNVSPSVTIGTGGVTWNASTRELTIPLGAGDSVANTTIARLIPGAVISVFENIVGLDYLAGNYGVVKSVYGTVSSATAVIDWLSPLAGTEIVGFYFEPLFTEIKVGRISRNYISVAHSDWSMRDQLITASYSRQNNAVYGRIKRLVVDVKRPYTGATTGNINLNLFDVRTAGFSTRLNLAIDLKTAGRRERTPSSNSGWTGTGGETSGANLSAGSFVSTAIGNFGITSTTVMASTSNDQLPIVDVLLELDSPYNRP